MFRRRHMHSSECCHYFLQQSQWRESYTCVFTANTFACRINSLEKCLSYKGRNNYPCIKLWLICVLLHLHLKELNYNLFKNVNLFFTKKMVASRESLDFNHHCWAWDKTTLQCSQKAVFIKICKEKANTDRTNFCSSLNLTKIIQTVLTKLAPFKTASIMPAVKAAQFNLPVIYKYQILYRLTG